jgi:hypothetical protein
LESREYNSRWFTEARAWKIEKEMQETYQQSRADEYSDIPPEPPISDDLPF